MLLRVLDPSPQSLSLTEVSLCPVRVVVERQTLGPVSRKSRKLFGSEKPFVKLRPAYSVKLVFSYVVKGIKIKITAKFRASRRLRFEDTKGIRSPEMRPKSSGTFEKRGPGPSQSSAAPNQLSLVKPKRALDVLNSKLPIILNYIKYGKSN